MSSSAADGPRTLGMPVGAAIAGLLALRVVVAGVMVWRADAVVDEGVRRFDRVAASPVTPYRHFAVEWMPLQTAVVQAVGGRGEAATAAGVVLLAAAADAAAAGALAWGWSRRAAAVYLVLGLPLLAAAYVRLDLIAVALAAWAFALGRRGRDGPAGAALALAALAGLWAALLLPWTLLRRRRPTLLAAAAVLAAGGAVWFVVGGPKAPMQVLSYRGATGWDVQSTVGTLLDGITDAATYLEGGILRIGFAPAWARSLLLLAVLGAAAAAWIRWRPTRDEAAGTTVLAIAASILALSPTYPPAWTSILVPWAAIAWDEDRAITAATAAAIALTAVLTAIASPEQTTTLSIVIVAVRQVALVAAAGLALTCRALRRV